MQKNLSFKIYVFFPLKSHFRILVTECVHTHGHAYVHAQGQPKLTLTKVVVVLRVNSEPDSNEFYGHWDYFNSHTDFVREWIRTPISKYITDIKLSV